MTTAAPPTIKPQVGPQEMFLGCPADIAIYGGAAGGGKSWALLMEPLRHVHRPGFTCTIFRKTTQQARKQGANWHQSMQLYPTLGGQPKEYILKWEFPSGASIQFGGLEHESSVTNYQTAEICLIAFDELTDFSERQFWFMLSRNRSTCGVRPYVRAACNPDADSWVANLISWWIDQDTGYPISERAGVIRWLYRDGDSLHWFDTKEQAMAKMPHLAAYAPPKSFTFIPAKVEDNAALLAADPGYMANLMALPLVDRERLLKGNWKIRLQAGDVFRREWLSQFVDVCPQPMRVVRAWDKAGSVTDGDFSVGVLMVEKNNLYYVADVVHGRWSPMERNRVMLATAETDATRFGSRVRLWIEQEPGNGGKESAQVSARELRKFSPRFDKPTTAKETRALPFSAQCDAGNVQIVRGGWNQTWIDELCHFPSEGWHDDQVDATSLAFNKLIKMPSSSGSLPSSSTRFGGRR